MVVGWRLEPGHGLQARLRRMPLLFLSQCGCTVIPTKAKRWTTASPKCVRGRPVWNGEINTAPRGHHLWNWPLTWPGVEIPALGQGQPSLIFVVVKGDLFYTKRVKEDLASINRVCGTIAASKHIGLLVTKYTEEMATYFAALDPRTVRRWRSQLWLCFSAENQEWFDKRWADIRPLAEAGWFLFIIYRTDARPGDLARSISSRSPSG